MRCKNCGCENDNNSLVCQNCGSPIYESDELNDSTGKKDSEMIYDYNVVKEKHKRTRNSILAIIIVLAIVLAGLVGVVIYGMTVRNNKKTPEAEKQTTSDVFEEDGEVFDSKVEKTTKATTQKQNKTTTKKQEKTTKKQAESTTKETTTASPTTTTTTTTTATTTTEPSTNGFEEEEGLVNENTTLTPEETENTATTEQTTEGTTAQTTEAEATVSTSADNNVDESSDNADDDIESGEGIDD